MNKPAPKSKALPKAQPLNKVKGGSYVKDPETGKRTLVQETKRETPKKAQAEK